MLILPRLMIDFNYFDNLRKKYHNYWYLIDLWVQIEILLPILSDLGNCPTQNQCCYQCPIESRLPIISCSNNIEKLQSCPNNDYETCTCTTSTSFAELEMDQEKSECNKDPLFDRKASQTSHNQFYHFFPMFLSQFIKICFHDNWQRKF